MQVRIDKLLALGALEQAAALIEAAGTPSPELFRRAFDVALLTGAEDRACQFMAEEPHLAPTLPALAVSFRPNAYTDDLYTNMIRATTMSMSAVLGGAARLTVLPYDAGREALATYPQAFSRRIARNVQHLLKMESGFDQLSDPAAGSYYIETLTRQLADQMWRELGGLQTPNL